MNRARLSLWPAIVALQIVATLILCGGLRAEDTQTPIEHFKAETDRVLDYLRANPNADWTDVRKHIEPIVAEIEQSDLTRDDLHELQRYMDQRGEDLKRRIAGFRKEMSAGSPLARSPKTGLAATCYSYCVGLVQFECGTDRVFGVCMGGWNCEAQMGAHLCLEQAGGDVGNPSTCKNDSECPPGYGCATWTFKPNECVEKCTTDSQCPSGQKCKKPIGTSFKRCK